jgi:superoxide reductase
MALKFYKCEKCGTVVIKPFDNCGEDGGKMVELTANTEEAAFEKHIPAVTVDGNAVHVEVGETIHPMLEEHFITFICLETKKGYQVVELAPGMEPIANFAVAKGDALVAAYEYCNLHGLWKAEI